jgi:hypothetical protein
MVFEAPLFVFFSLHDRKQLVKNAPGFYEA